MNSLFLSSYPSSHADTRASASGAVGFWFGDGCDAVSQLVVLLTLGTRKALERLALVEISWERLHCCRSREYLRGDGNRQARTKGSWALYCWSFSIPHHTATYIDSRMHTVVEVVGFSVELTEEGHGLVDDLLVH
jgi:hypothetical protein